MPFTELTPKQAEAFRNHIRPMLHFLLRCRRRLDARGFDPKGALYQTIDKAYSALPALHVQLHYLSGSHGVGELPEQESAPPSCDGLELRGTVDMAELSDWAGSLLHPREKARAAEGAVSRCRLEVV
jgi:hypothetical protein